ncbi:putative RWD domain-containing protein 1-like [Apostichopus japonicus]|uniref:Putative RWD domain-containing protein 1-like n=1 Tax=Stichopus japonicus TaxID=307972 RepID=A0A2G8KID3_STIJA|nr:putative RWD domain-containing protein 1-like [Apostichopus japonicus]
MMLSDEPFHTFKITVSSEETDDLEDGPLEVTLQFTYTPTYPDEAPEYQVIPDESLQESHLESLKQILEQQIEENLGMAMVFALVSATQEFLNDMIDNLKKEKEEELEREEEIKRLAEEERDKILKGTPVTIESFLSWKEQFDQEMAELKSKSQQNEGGNKKLTGDRVEVDESLFQEIDDLDLDAELDLADDS